MATLAFSMSAACADRVRLAAFAALGTDVVGADVAAPVRTEIGLGLDERPRVRNDVENALIERLGRDRLGHEFGDAGVARRGDAMLFRVSGEHDDRDVGIGVCARLPDHLREFEAVEDRHRPVGDDDVRHEMRKGLEPGGAVFGLVDFARAESVQERAYDASHVHVVVDDEKPKSVEIDTKHGTTERPKMRHATRPQDLCNRRG